jgi:hypothetical protein
MGDEDFPPLLGAGLHEMSFAELESLVLEGFPLSESRPKLWQNFAALVTNLKKLKIPCVIWVDGSFLSKKINPDDVDFVALIPVEVLYAADASQLDLIDQLTTRAFKKTLKLHSFVLFPVPPEDPGYAAIEVKREQWKKDFGFRYDKREPKGIAVIEVKP